MGAPVTVIKTAAETAIPRHFEAARRWLPGRATERVAAMAAFEAMGLPHRRIEAWHYTDLRSLMRAAAAPAIEPNDEVAVSTVPWSLVEGAHTITIVNGWMAGTYSLPPGVEVLRMADALAIGHPDLARLGQVVDLGREAVVQVNAALMTDGVILRVPAGLAVEAPIHLAFEAVMSGAALAVPRLLVLMEEGASLTLLETHRGPDGIAHQTNIVAEMAIGANARLTHVRVQRPGDQAQMISTLALAVAAGAQVSTLSVVAGGALTRHQVFARMHGDHARLGVRGVALLRGEEHGDHTLVLEHDALHGESRELFRTVVDDRASGVFQGKIIVRPGAQKTDGRMASNALLLGEHASMAGKPELEIFADDVQCAHGATVGALDDDLLFYLMSRGLPRRAAEGLMIQAFCGEAIDATTDDEGVRTAVHGIVAAWVAQRSGGGA